MRFVVWRYPVAVAVGAVMGPLVALGTAAVLLLGDPGFVVAGQVRFADGGAGSAELRVRCAEGVRPLGEVLGRFSTGAIGCVGERCVVEALVDGGVSAAADVGANCVRGSGWKCGGGCGEVQVDLGNQRTSRCLRATRLPA